MNYIPGFRGVTPSVREYLSAQDYDAYIPKSYDMTPEQKERALFYQAEMGKFKVRAVTQCMEPCLKHMNSTVVTEGEYKCW